MRGSIALAWILATVLFALIGQAWLTVVFFVFAVLFSFFTISNEYSYIKSTIIDKLVKGETDES